MSDAQIPFRAGGYQPGFVSSLNSPGAGGVGARDFLSEGTAAGHADRLAGGATYRDIAQDEGLAYGTARMRCRRAGLRSKHKGRQPDAATAKRIAIARAMFAQGCDNDDVAHRLGMKKPAVRMMLMRAERAGR